VAVCVTVAGAMMIRFALQLAEVSARTVKDLVRSTPPDYETFAVGLRNLGVQSGDRLAVVGYPFDPYYAPTLDCVLLRQSLLQMSSGI
jgi:hypothetical protein